MHMKLLDLETMSRGTDRQKQAYKTLQDLNVFEKLKSNSPVLAGAIPLDLESQTSDNFLEVICSTENLEDFAAEAEKNFGDQPGFGLAHLLVNSKPTVLVTFQTVEFPIEIFTQMESVFTQSAVVNMLVEARLLAFAPKTAKEAVRAQINLGSTIEEAFAHVFEIQGDPGAELLKLSRSTDRDVLMVAHRFHFAN